MYVFLHDFPLYQVNSELIFPTQTIINYAYLTARSSKTSFFDFVEFGITPVPNDKYGMVWYGMVWYGMV